jgi:hypothetical protein
MLTGIQWDTIGSGIKAIGLGHRMSALVGGLLVISAGNTLKVTGKESVGVYRMTTTRTMTGTGIFERKARARIDSSGGSNDRLTIEVSTRKRYTPCV